MDLAISLKTGDRIKASGLAKSPAAYRASLKHLLVCPECGEPVHFRRRETPYNTPFFAHYKQADSVKAIYVCSLRVFGAAFRPASQILPSIKHGQLVDRFQREFCKALHQSFGRYSADLYSYIENAPHDRLAGRAYSSFVDALARKASFSGVTLDDLEIDTAWLNEAIDDICLFLRSSYGEWVGNFIHHVARFVATTVHPDLDEDDIGRAPFEIARRQVVFVAEPIRLKNVAELDGITSARRHRIVAQIAGALVAYLVLKWRAPSKVVGLFGVADSIARENYEIKSSRTRLPVYRRPAPTNAPAPRASDPAHLPEGYPTRGLYWSHEPEPTLPSRWPSLALQPYPASPTSSHPLAGISPPTSVRLLTQSPVGGSAATAGSDTAMQTTRSAPRLSSIDEQRIRQLVSESVRLAHPARMRIDNRDALLSWSGRQNPFEAYFLAALLNVAHKSPEFSDPTLAAKLDAWVEWARQAK